MSVADSLFAFSFAALLLTLTPGLDTALILRTATAEGGKRAFQAALASIPAVLSGARWLLLGLAPYWRRPRCLYDLPQMVRGGISFLARDPVTAKTTTSRGRPALRRRTRAIIAFVRGLLSNTLNPKMGVFYVSFLPQFIPSGHSPILWTFILVAIHVALGTHGPSL
ncbi:leucine export protein LeuE [Kluyvera cryocrescens]|uniref:Leucine export protein LeuE n=1 Tax=Kluyvera cryocrescens TaxID=580 RepID=A0A485CS78_KLUCR|nr:leucine export protein LeuE [Kluyvera cryocrescens]